MMRVVGDLPLMATLPELILKYVMQLPLLFEETTREERLTVRRALFAHQDGAQIVVEIQVYISEKACNIYSSTTFP